MRGVDFPYLQEFRDRTIDIGEPSAAILEAVYEYPPRLAEMRADFINAITITRDEQQLDVQDHRILRELARLAKKDDPLIGNSSELHGLCSNLPEAVSRWTISHVLRKYGFATRSVRKGSGPKYRYVLEFKELAEILERYAGSGEVDE